MMAIGLALEMSIRIVVLMIDVLLRKKEKTRKFGLEDPKFDGYLSPHVFSNWLNDMKCYFDCYEMSDMHKIQFAKMRLVGLANIY